MELKKKWNHFWTLNRCHAEGFTLVELIVVIAILAILAGIAVPAYSGYVDKANQQADITLAREVAQALELAFYDQTLPNGGSVVLTKDGAEADGDVEAALVAVFGSVDSIAGLKYDGWNGAYNGDSSYSGNEIGLLGNVEGMTETLAEFLKNNAETGVTGGRFASYMTTELDFGPDDLDNKDKVADAAVLYIANTTKKLDATQQAALKKVGSNSVSNNPLNLFQNVLDTVYPATDTDHQNVFAATATTYALMAGYYSYIGQELPDIDDARVEKGTAADMMNVLTDTFGAHFYNADGTAKAESMASWKKYLEEQSATDASAFMEVMGTVDSAKGQLSANLGAAYDPETGTGCFNSTEVQNWFTSYSAGNIVVLLEVKADGTPVSKTIPELN